MSDDLTPAVIAERIAGVNRRIDDLLGCERTARDAQFFALDRLLNDRMAAVNKALELAQNNHRSALTAWIAVILALLSAALSLYKHG